MSIQVNDSLFETEYQALKTSCEDYLYAMGWNSDADVRRTLAMVPFETLADELEEWLEGSPFQVNRSDVFKVLEIIQRQLRDKVVDETYDGWKTQETWIVALWLQNDEELRRTAQEVEDIESWVRYELAPTTGLIADLTLSAIRKVDWNAIRKIFEGTT